MTCIVGIEHGGKVYIGGDSAGVAGYSISVRADSKVFTNGPYVMGFTSSFRMGQLLRYKLNVPEFNDRTDQLDRTCLRDGGWLESDKNVERGGTFLVGFKGTLFVVAGDFQVGKSLDGYDAVGCGDEIALGSLHGSVKEPPRARLTKALEAAAHHSAGVTGPFVIEEGP